MSQSCNERCTQISIDYAFPLQTTVNQDFILMNQRLMNIAEMYQTIEPELELRRYNDVIMGQRSMIKVNNVSPTSHHNTNKL